jgi:hypothetical protein
MHALLP